MITPIAMKLDEIIKHVFNVVGNFSFKNIYRVKNVLTENSQLLDDFNQKGKTICEE